MAPFLAPLVGVLAKEGISFVSDAIKGGGDKAREFVEEKTGLDLEREAEKAATTGTLDQKTLTKLKEIESKERQNLKALALENVKDARDMQKEALKQEDRFSKRFIYYLALFWSLAAVSYIFGITFLDVPQENIRIIDTILGFMIGSVIGTIINFFFGNSEVPQKMQDLMKKGG